LQFFLFVVIWNNKPFNRQITKAEKVKFFSKIYYEYRKIWKIILLYLMIAGPGIVVMVADNDAGGITT
jgi:hypothetical protein